MQRRFGLLFVTGLLVLTACGGESVFEELEEFDAGASDDDSSGGSTGDAETSQGGAGAGDTNVIVTVDGNTYMVDTARGGTCSTQSDPGSGNELTAYGYDEESGRRVELSLGIQGADTSISGEEEFYGGLFIASDEGQDYQMRTTEAWPWLSGDRSSVSGTVTMEDFDGVPAEVTFEVTCP